LNKELQTGEEEILRMRERIEERTRQLAKLEARIAAASASYATLKPQVEKQTGQLEALIEERDKLRRSVPLLEREFSAYRNQQNQRPVAGPIPAPAQPAVKPGGAAADTGRLERIKQVQAAVRLAETRVQAISTQLDEARGNLAAGRKSVPGSLETWQARASRLQLALTKARTELELAKADLAALSSGTPQPR
jgi:DNA repair exonuclease SbcCD ATPase subunit